MDLMGFMHVRDSMDFHGCHGFPWLSMDVMDLAGQQQAAQNPGKSWTHIMHIPWISWVPWIAMDFMEFYKML